MSDIAGRLHDELDSVGLPWHSVEEDEDQVTIRLTSSQAEGLIAVLSMIPDGVKPFVFNQYSRIIKEG